MAHFTDATFDFLFELDVHNSKEWMDENRHRYESEVKQPMFRFVEALAEPMHKAVSKHLVVVPKIQRGSVFQQHRDTRFSHDKRPYKSNCGANFRHAMADGDVAAPGLYLHLEPGNCFMGGGIYRPPNPVLTKIREAVVADRSAWARARNNATSSGYELGGDSLTRAPRGFDADDPAIEDLRRTSFVISRRFDDEETLRDDFLDTYVGWCRETAPFLRYLCKALAVPF
ncbi:MAG: hypothetical protein ACI970_000694 [Myxococcota bacterium]|jgi:uncharacterized protein (TIGR02453 family)